MLLKLHTDEMASIHSSEAGHRVRVSLGSLGKQCGPWRPSRDLAEADLAQLASLPPLEAARRARQLQLEAGEGAVRPGGHSRANSPPDVFRHRHGSVAGSQEHHYTRSDKS